MTEIRSQAFNNNPHLERITVESATPPIPGEDGFHQYTYFSASLEVPVEAVMAYRRAAEWINFENINNVRTNIDIIAAGSEERGNARILYDLQGRKAISGKGLRIDSRKRRVEIGLSCFRPLRRAAQ